MRRASKKDANQTEIVDGLRVLGASVCVLSAVGKGCPDLVAGWRGINYLLEIKDGEAPPSEQRLTPDQVTWHSAWRGQVAVVKSLSDALTVMRKLP